MSKVKSVIPDSRSLPTSKIRGGKDGKSKKNKVQNLRANGNSTALQRMS